MNIRNEKLIAVFFVALLTLSGTMVALPVLAVPPTAVSVVPSPLEFGPAACVGTEFQIKVVISDVADLYGMDIKFAWNPTYLLYLNHTIHIPVESFADGVLHSPVLPVKNEVDSGAGTYWIGYASMSPAAGFDGTGIVFDMFFKIVKQPMSPDPDVTLTMDIVSADLPNSGGTPIAHDTNDGTVIIHTKPFEYPPEPLLKILPASVSGLPVGSTFESDVYLMGVGGVDLDGFWDVAGFDIYVNFKRADPPYLLLEALDVTIDPDGWFAAFWPGGVFEIENTVNNAEGWVHVAFLGLPGSGGVHTAPYGSGRLLSITFNAIYESSTYPPPTVDITLKNPRSFAHRLVLDADAGLINLSSPVGTEWTAIDSYDIGTPYSLNGWVDKDFDGNMGPGDELILNDTSSGKWHRYVMYDLKGTLQLAQQAFVSVEDIWAADFLNNAMPESSTGGGTPAAFNGFGNPYWTGDFSMLYPVDTLNNPIHVQFLGNGTERDLIPGTEYTVNPDGTIELLVPLDFPIYNEHYVVGVNATPGGWPAIQYVASGIQNVYVDFNNGTERDAINIGFEANPPAEWWYEPAYPYEVEAWWIWYDTDFNALLEPLWPSGTEYWVNYTAASLLTVDYTAQIDPRPYYLEFDGSYADFLALGDPVGIMWNEMYPNTLNTWNCTGWTDADTSGDITAGDILTLESTLGVRNWLVNKVSTDITVDQVRTICDDNPGDPYYGVESIVAVAGFPHTDYPWCPWHGSELSVPLPCQVTSATFEAYFAALGASIDLYTQYPIPFGGQGPHNPSDMFWPQKEVILYAYVTYNKWPEQNKDVAFEVKDNHMNVWGIFYARTNTVGLAYVKVRLPWPCDTPDYYRGEWHVYATVDVACKVINDTLNFKYDYLVNIWKVTTDKDSYVHCEDMVITIDYGSYVMQEHNVTLTVTVVDETGVPFGYTYVRVTIGGAVYCSYNNATVVLTVHVIKFARAGEASVYVGALSDFPQNGGDALGPLYAPPPQVGILAE